jgi:NADPH-dependent curcumin reductase CurA
MLNYRMQGFIVFDHQDEYAAGRQQLAEWLAEGKLKRKETIVKGGLKSAEQALVDLYRGINTGKLSISTSYAIPSPTWLTLYF